MSGGQLQRVFPVAQTPFSYQLEIQGDKLSVTLGGETVLLEVVERGTRDGWCRTPEGRTYPFALAWVGEQLHLWLDGRLYIYQRPATRRRRRRDAGPGTGEVAAPMPGKVLRVLVRPGEAVEADQPLLIMESMKTELVLRAPRAGTVKGIVQPEGSQVERGALLVELE